MTQDERNESEFRAFLQIPSITATAGEEQAARWVESRLAAEGIASERVEAAPGRPNVLACLTAARESALPPLVLISHVDVVAAEEKRWSQPPFGAAVDGGRIFARGSLDTKQLTLMELEAFCALHRRGAPLARTVWLIASIDEEAGSRFGMEAVKRARPELFRQAVVWNEGGGFPLHSGGRDYMTLTMGEKACCHIRVTARGTAGHAAAPGREQAIVHLAAALRQIFLHTDGLPAGSCGVAKAMRQALGTDAPDNALAAQLLAYAQHGTADMRRYRIGQRVNVLPAAAQAELTLRLLPGATAQQTEAWLAQCLAGTQAEGELLDFEPGFAAEPLSPEGMALTAALRTACRENGLACEVLPMLALGRTDGRFFGTEGSSVFGCSPLLPADAFDAILPKVHGDNESITQASFAFGCRVLDKLISALACGELAGAPAAAPHGGGKGTV